MAEADTKIVSTYTPTSLSKMIKWIFSIEVGVISLLFGVFITVWMTYSDVKAQPKVDGAQNTRMDKQDATLEAVVKELHKISIDTSYTRGVVEEMRRDKSRR